MKTNLFSTLLALALYSMLQAQVGQRLTIASAYDPLQPQRNYAHLITDDLNQTVPVPWDPNPFYSDVVMPLDRQCMLTRISLYDMEGIFTAQPAYLYAMYRGHRIFLGRFDGLLYKQWVHYDLPFAVPADSLIMRKYGNHIPQKVFAYGHIGTPTSVQQAQAQRMRYDSIVSLPPTGMDFSPWLSDRTDSLVRSVHTPANLQYADVEIKLPAPALVQRLQLFDWTGVFTDRPATLLARWGDSLTPIGTFDGRLYNAWVTLAAPAPLLASSIVVRKYGNNIPQKVQVFGNTLPIDPLDTVVVERPDFKLPYSHITAPNTLQNFQPWLSESLTDLVQSSWATANMTYVDVTLHFSVRSRVGSLVLFDHAGIFTTNPAYILLKKDTVLTQVAVFEGRRFNVLDTLVLPDSLDADAVVVRKYGNNYPQKIWAYGRPTPPPPPAQPELITRIPIDTSRLFILNYAPGGLNTLFDGAIDKNPSTGFGNYMEDYEAWYPLEDGEGMRIHEVRMYDLFGTFSDNPATIWVAKANGERRQIATFTGSRFQVWVGPDPQKNPGTPQLFQLDTIAHDFRYIVLGIHKNNLPAEIEFWGTYTPPTTAILPPPRPKAPLEQAVGMNAFEWDFVVPSVNSRLLSQQKYAPIKAFKGFRHYLDWQRIENTEGSFSFNPAHWGGWSYDLIYEQCFKDSIEVLVCFQNVPPWMRNTYPEGEQSVDNSPIKFGLDRLNPAAYIEKSRAGFQLAARYGRNANIDPALLKVNTQPRWHNDPANEVKTGLGWVKYIECDNEANKWWRGRKGYLSAFEYAAHLSAFYDGHMGTLGPDAGVKTADPTMQVVMMGMAAADPSYLRGMVEWCRMHRGYLPNGAVNLCWDVINYHHYTNDRNTDQTGQATRGMAIELSQGPALAQRFMEFSQQYCGNMPVWLTEVGYDLHQQSTMKAIPIGPKAPLQTQADWILRSALVYMRSGIDHIFFYELNDNNPFSSTKYNSMGMVDSLFQLRPSGNYLHGMRQLFGKHTYQRTLHADPVVDEYKWGSQYMYAMWIPDEAGRTGSYTLRTGSAIGAMVYVPAESGPMQGYWLNADDGSVVVPVSETPVFVVPMQQLPNLISTLYQK